MIVFWEYTAELETVRKKQQRLLQADYTAGTKQEGAVMETLIHRPLWDSHSTNNRVSQSLSAFLVDHLEIDKLIKEITFYLNSRL